MECRAVKPFGLALALTIICGNLWAEEHIFPTHQIANGRRRILAVGDRAWTASAQVRVNGQDTPIVSRDGRLLTFDVQATTATVPVQVTDGAITIGGGVIGGPPTLAIVDGVLEDLQQLTAKVFGIGLIGRANFVRIQSTLDHAERDLNVDFDLSTVAGELGALRSWLASGGARDVPVTIRESLTSTISDVINVLPLLVETQVPTMTKTGQSLLTMPNARGQRVPSVRLALVLTDNTHCWPVTVVFGPVTHQAYNDADELVEDTTNNTIERVEVNENPQGSGEAKLTFPLQRSRVPGVVKEVWTLEIDMVDNCGHHNKTVITEVLIIV